ncbi:MAG: GNAT family N-acetyltransferase, partial [Chloroflexota bacterium]
RGLRRSEPELSPETITALNNVLPRHWSHGNPIDIIGDADLERYREAIGIAAKEPNSDALLVLLTPQDMTNPTQTATALIKIANDSRKPILTSWMGGATIAAGAAILNQANIPTFSYPDTAAKAFSYMWQYQQNLQSLYETPSLTDLSKEDKQEAKRVINAVLRAKRSILTEFESKAVVAAYGIPTVETRLATSDEEAVTAAETIGYPVVLKLHSEIITHKSDVGGVQLNLANAEAVRHAYQAIQKNVVESLSPDAFSGVTVQPMMLTGESYELILGSSIDPQFGPVLLFGSGGRLVEIFQDRALGLPPLNSTLARRMINQTQVSTALKGIRGQAPVDLAALEQLLVRLSHLVVEQPWIKEIDINPLLADSEKLVALDARIILHPSKTRVHALPKLAIRPYPVQYIEAVRLSQGLEVTVRPIRAEDEPLMVEFHKTLSQESIYSRFFTYFPVNHRIDHDRLSRVCFVDYNNEIAIVAEHHNPETNTPEILGVARIIKLADEKTAEFSVLVSDDWQGHGVGGRLLSKLINIARQEGYEQVVGSILPNNQKMQRLCRKLGFELAYSLEDNLSHATFDLSQ